MDNFANLRIENFEEIEVNVFRYQPRNNSHISDSFKAENFELIEMGLRANKILV